VLLQVVVLFGYGVTFVLKDTLVLGSDRYWRACEALLALFLVAHSIINCVLIDLVGYVARVTLPLHSPSIVVLEENSKSIELQQLLR
jgi:hypothetical protein